MPQHGVIRLLSPWHLAPTITLHETPWSQNFRCRELGAHGSPWQHGCDHPRPAAGEDRDHAQAFDETESDRKAEIVFAGEHMTGHPHDARRGPIGTRA